MVTSESARKKLESGRESALLSQELVTLKRDVPGLPGLAAMEHGRAEARCGHALFRARGYEEPRHGIDRPAKRGSPHGTVAAKPVTPAAGRRPRLSCSRARRRNLYDDHGALASWISGSSGRRAPVSYAFDVETDSTDEMRAHCRSVSP